MNKFTKLILTSAIISTSGFATTIDGTENIAEGGLYEIKDNDCALTGTMTLAGSETDGKAAKLVINETKTLDVQGGTLKYEGSETHTPEITLNGTLKLSKNEDTDPTVKLNDVGIKGEEIVQLQGTHNFKGILKTLVPYTNDINGTYYINYGVVGNYIVNCDTNEKFIVDYDIANVDKEYVNGNTITLSRKYGQDYERLEFQITSVDEENGTLTYSAKNYINATGSEYLDFNNSGTLSINVLTKLGQSYFADTYCIYLNGNIQEGKFIGEIYFGTESSNDLVTVNRVPSGTLDMSGLRTYAETAIDTLDLSSNISGIAPTALGTAKLPFNCQFSNVDLINVNSVEYTKLIIGESSGPGIEDSVIKRVITQAAATYGDYKNDASLGVTTTANGTVQTIEGTKTDLDFATLAGDSDTYNKEGLKLLTDDLDDKTHAIVADTSYNFGFIGSTAISVTGEHKAKFMGDSSEYNPADDSLTLPTEVEFGGDKSLFPITQTYGHGTFSGSCANEVTEDKTVTFSNGFSIESGHTLTIKGSLIG